jgi:4-hydroxyproline epimerase
MRQIRVIDSHTAGEPTRLVIEGGPDLGRGPLTSRAAVFRERFDGYRSALVNEPRGSDPMVGALLCEPERAHCQFGVIFFNNIGYLGMCGHGTLGLVASLAHLGLLRAGDVAIDTPVGPVRARLDADGQVELENVASFRAARALAIEVPGIGEVVGDLAWGGNWFFLVDLGPQRIDVDQIDGLTDFCRRIRQALNEHGHPEVDHVEVFGHAASAGADCRNFVLCPGNAYDRSPCGTGTSAKLACLAAEGTLEEDQRWVQESVIGSRFSARYRWLDRDQGLITPFIKGRAHVTGDAKLLIADDDPFAWGIPR